MTTVVLGLDGASFELVDRWREAGDLPTLDRLVTEGIAGDLQSCLPPVTCPNWRAYATGLNPGKLGVFWWEAIDRSERTITPTSDRSQFDGREYWTLLDGQTAVVNLPTSYPPPQIDGLYVAGGPGADQRGYTQPSELEADLTDQYGYQIHPEKLSLLSRDDPDSPCVEEIYQLIDQRFDLLIDLVRSGDYQHIHATVFYLNVLQHFYWDHDVVREAWQRIDDRLAELLSSEELETLFVMSDHGSNEIRTTFHVNTWLEQEGYLTTSGGGTELLSRVGLTRERIRPIVGRLGLEWWVRRLLPQHVQELLPDSEGRVSKAAKAHVIDWDDSVAVASGQGPVYILAQDPAERQDLRAELATKFEALTDASGEAVIETAHPGEEVYDGPYVSAGPDLLLSQAPNVHIEGAIGGDAVFTAPETWRGENKETGLFLAHGDGIGSGTVPGDLHILDLAPTLLHFHGEPVPTAMDGSVRTELFDPDSPAATRTVETVELNREGPTASGPASNAVADRLTDLGYL